MDQETPQQHEETTPQSAQSADNGTGAEQTPNEQPTETPKKKKSSFFKSDKKEWEEKIATLTEELAEQKDKYVRLYAEFDNFRRRTMKEKEDLIKTAGQGVIKDLLPVIDDMERAKAALAASNDLEALQNGFELIMQKFMQTMQNKGLKEMASTGEDFNPEWHEAIAEIPAPAEEQKGKVIDTTEKGYYLNEKIIRYAKVVVGK